MHEFCLQLTTRAVEGLRRFVVANGGSGGSDSKASATVLGRGSARAGSTGSGSTGSGSGPGSGPGRTGSSFGPMFGRHAVWESPFEQLERRVGDEASALLALLASANSSGLVSHTQLRVGWLRYAEQQQQQQQRQQDGNDGNRTELFARLKDIASARHGIAVDVVPPAEETPAAAAGGEAAAAAAAETPAPPREKWWNAYHGLQFLSRSGSRSSLPPLSGDYSLQLLDSKEFWEGEMDELFVCHVAEKCTTDPNDEKGADDGGRARPRHLCLTITSFESGVGALQGLPQFFWHWVGTDFHSGRSTTWPFDDSDLKASWKWGPGWKGGKFGPTNAWVFDATALDVPRAVPLLYADAARLRAEVDALGRSASGWAGAQLAGRKLHHLLASVAEQILSTQVAPSDDAPSAPQAAAASAPQRADGPGAEGGAASMGVAATDPAVASALAMLPAARRCAVAALVANGEATPEDVRNGSSAWRSCGRQPRATGIFARSGSRCVGSQAVLHRCQCRRHICVRPYGWQRGGS